MIEVSAKLFRIASYFQANNEIRYYLNGVFIEKADEGVVLVATDGHRLMVINDKEGKIEGESKIIKTNKSLISESKKTKSEKLERKIRVSFDGEVSIIKDGKPILSCPEAIIDGTFPKWRSAFKWDIESPSNGAFNAKYLSDFGKASKEISGSDFISIKGTENGPAIVNFYNCDYAFGVIMPVRFGDMGVPNSMKYLESN